MKNTSPPKNYAVNARQAPHSSTEKVALTTQVPEEHFPGFASAEASSPLILEGVTYIIGRQTILKDVFLTIARKEICVVMGLSGSGKTSLLRLMIGLAKPSEGRVMLFGNDITDCSEDALNQLRRRMGMVFQYSALFDSLSVGENVAFPLRQHTHLPKEAIEATVEQKLALVGLPGTENLFPDQLSGGMKKRVGIARALALDPEMILYDEPTSGLDSLNAARINNLIMELRENLGVTSVVVTHDAEVVKTMADRVGILHEGILRAHGSLEEICSSEDALVRQLVHCHPEGPI
jgi:phospholipid/cholesterol/gamma-HCH transport system ATP-binding protein